METLNRLLTLARSITKSPESIEAEIGLIDSYVALFDEWNRSGGPASVSEADRKALEELSHLHSRVTERASELKSLVMGEMKQLRTKAKGIIAYTDILPKSLSLGKTTKG